jgi:hypothetical protein
MTERNYVTKVVKLVTGETLVTDVAPGDHANTTILHDPHLIVPAANSSIALMPWIPYSCDQEGEVTIHDANILMRMEAVEPLKEEFKNKSTVPLSEFKPDTDGFPETDLTAEKLENAASGPVGNTTESIM